MKYSTKAEALSLETSYIKACNCARCHTFLLVEHCEVCQHMVLNAVCSQLYANGTKHFYRNIIQKNLSFLVLLILDSFCQV